MNLFAAALAATVAAGGLPGITGPAPEPVTCTADVTGEVTLFPTWSGRDLFSVPVGGPSAVPPGYTLVDLIERSVYVPAGECYSVMVDYDAGTLVESAPCELTATALSAVAHVPEWIRPALEWNLSLLGAENQDRYGNLLLGITDEQILDEVAFQVAHLSWTILANTSWDEGLLVENAQLIYQIDPELQYVDVVDYLYAPGGTWSTTAYEVVEDGDTVTVEIPREIYYWYVVMPKVSDERPLMDSTVYGYFWREYLYYFHDETYPDMREVMAPLTVLWDGQPQSQGLGDPFTSDMLALEAISLWEWKTVPEAAWGNRPIQPNIIAHEHNGNCGETQDLLCAAARTCLVPTICTMDILEDHVWCEFWWDGEWHPWQPDWIDNPYIAYDEQYCPGGKACSCIWDWRNDGLTWGVSETYSDVCTLSVHVQDSLGVPVDNATVSIGSEGYYNPTVGRGVWGETDGNGDIQFVLGDSQNYYVMVSSTLGVWPASGYALVIENSVTGQHYYWSHSTASPMPVLEATELPPASSGDYFVECGFTVEYDLMNGRDYYASPYSRYAEPVGGGSLAFFLADQENMDAYLAGGPFEAWEVASGAQAGAVEAYLPADGDCHAVLSGIEHQGFASRVGVSISLWQSDEFGCPGGSLPGAPGLSVAPNPAFSTATIAFELPGGGEAAISVYDVTGRLEGRIYSGTPGAGAHEMSWDLCRDGGAPLPPGIYLVRLDTPSGSVVRRLAVLR